MFKKVSYVGLDPNLRALVDRAMPVLADEIRTWREEVEVEWDASGTPVWQAGAKPDARPGVFLELRLKLPNSTGVVRRLLTAEYFGDERRLRSICRDAWGRLLDILLEQQNERLKEYLVQTAEA